MTIAGLDHFTILTEDIAATRRFYCELLGLSEGPRPPFDFPGAWLYAGGHPVVHIVAGRKVPAGGTGALDHLAFKAGGDPAALKQRLEAAGCAVTARVVPGSGIHQLFCHDPSGVRVELNFPAG
ncbi:MAG: VOC family protein [Rhodospirillales bacterium]|nr:VOC family protein [Rhodospirillales bacterium]